MLVQISLANYLDRYWVRALPKTFDLDALFEAIAGMLGQRPA